MQAFKIDAGSDGKQLYMALLSVSTHHCSTHDKCHCYIHVQVGIETNVQCVIVYRLLVRQSLSGHIKVCIYPVNGL